MQGLSFKVQKPISSGSPNRMDIACFVGLVDVRKDAVRDDVNHWLYEQSWLNPEQDYKAPYLRTATYHRDSANELLDVPVPIESWERFNQLYAWQQRKVGENLVAACYLGMAVRSFFAQGGRKCYVVRVANPLPFMTEETERSALIKKLVPGFPSAVSSIPSDRTSWSGVGHLLGLPDVSMLCLPDLPDLVHAEPAEVDSQIVKVDESPEQFVKCSDPVARPLPDSFLETLPAPTSDDNGYQLWCDVIHEIASFISVYRRDVQLIASLPLPDKSSTTSSSLQQIMHQQSWFNGTLDNDKSIASAFVQLCYPWLKTAGSTLLPQTLEPPDGSLCGMLARNALTRGAYRSVTGMNQIDIQALFPALSQENIYSNNVRTNTGELTATPLIDRITLFGITLDGISVLSDVTTSNSISYRPANINRIFSMMIRVARLAGEEYVFENNGDILWAKISQHLNGVLRVLFELGALRGKQAEEAYFVRCDRSTMTQQDIDSGRVIAQIQFAPAASIESIDVLLTMNKGGSVSLDVIGLEQAVA
ncbi:MAG: hypothetical protein IMF15_06860 [Proteobacteria bacterium]|nr:hypothetical protein [Pseudomonadota bacterium]